jgi:glycolate oxidase FAD binding subunit
MLNKNKIISPLNKIVGDTHLMGDPDKLKIYGVDGKVPKAVVFPGTIEEVSKLIAHANQHNLTVVPMGNGTKMGMGGVPKEVDIVLSTGRLRRLTDCDCDNLTLSAESGITLGEVQKNLAEKGRGYFLPLDPPFTDKATLGGIVATNSSGPKRLLYGTARDLIIGSKAVFPNGNIVASGGKTVKNVSGYDMCKLLIGSFGTLGILCEMTFKLLPLPEKEATLFIPFPNLSNAVGFTHEILHSQLIPSSMDILNAMAYRTLKCRISIPPEARYLIAIGLEGIAESVERQTVEMMERGKKQGALSAAALHAEEHRAFWIALRDFSLAVKGIHPDFIALKSNFLISRCEEMMRNCEETTARLGLECALICRSGNGILYSYILMGEQSRSESDVLKELIENQTSGAVKNEGNLVVEFCTLPLKQKVNVWGYPRGDYQIMRRLKEEIDPEGILNPGRFAGGI